jgi:DNA mismatch endonuclease (patch repair protein)
MDIVSPEVRRRMMQGIRSKNTTPERIVRSVAHGLGLRFRLHRQDLPGKPDLVFPKFRTVILVHGCFWHRHDCSLAAMPKTRTEFWASKFEANVKRDQRVRERLSDLGWRVIEVWECETRRTDELTIRLAGYFGLGDGVLSSLPSSSRSGTSR